MYWRKLKVAVRRPKVADRRPRVSGRERWVVRCVAVSSDFQHVLLILNVLGGSYFHSSKQPSEYRMHDSHRVQHVRTTAQSIDH